VNKKCQFYFKQLKTTKRSYKMTSKKTSNTLDLLSTSTATVTDTQASENHGLNIIVLTNGFVYVGDVTVTEKWITVTNATNIRRWGTTKGLGELCAGPTSSTHLDKTGTLKINPMAFLFLLTVEEAGWRKYL
jgi:hypothetical protein